MTTTADTDDVRDTFAAVFFVAFALSVDVGALGDVVVPVLLAPRRGC